MNLEKNVIYEIILIQNINYDIQFICGEFHKQSKHISMKNVQLLMALEGRIGVTLNGRGVTLGTNKMFPFELVLL